MNVMNIDEIITRNKVLEEENAKLKDELDDKNVQIYLQKKLCNDWKYIIPDFERPVQIKVFDDGNEKYKQLDNIWYIFGESRGKVALCNAFNPATILRSISFWKITNLDP
jgi:regulator of replication initiation timing